MLDMGWRHSAACVAGGSLPDGRGYMPTLDAEGQVAISLISRPGPKEREGDYLLLGTKLRRAVSGIGDRGID